jgi:pyridoxamine 5'-phosphate oxidase
MADTHDKDLIAKTPSATDYAAVGTQDGIPDTDAPFDLFAAWLRQAQLAEPNDGNAMSLATVDERGLPDVRIVLLKDFTEVGFIFYTNLESAKARELDGSSKAALCFHWKSLRRQVRVRGHVEPVSSEAADAYFASRTRLSQLGAWASDQSRPLKSRESLTAKETMLGKLHEGEDIPRPPNWGGYCLVPSEIEFWADMPYRLHDRLLFTRKGDGWDSVRLNP